MGWLVKPYALAAKHSGDSAFFLCNVNQLHSEAVQTNQINIGNSVSWNHLDQGFSSLDLLIVWTRQIFGFGGLPSCALQDV